jgi:TetR/AcrR family transcriptional regulator, mexCD-oprJ operon repressor
MATTAEQGSGRAHKRLDARRNIAAILDAAAACLAANPDASITEIARAAGVGRVTLYGHFDSRANLIEAVVARAIRQTEEALDALDLGGEPPKALRRLIDSNWQVTHEFGALLVAAERSLTAERIQKAHADLEDRLRGLVERGQRKGVFRADLSSRWLVTLIHGVFHAAATAVHEGEIGAEEAPQVISSTLLAAFTPPGRTVPRGSGLSTRRDGARGRPA